MDKSANYGLRKWLAHCILFVLVVLLDKGFSAGDASGIIFEDDNIRVTKGKTITYFASEKEHCNFPRYTELPNGDIYVAHSIGTHGTPKERKHIICSGDGGKTWEEVPSYPKVVLADGSGLWISFLGEKVDDRTFRFKVQRSTNNWKDIEDSNSTVTFPHEIDYIACHGRYIELRDGTILAGVYGLVKGDKKDSTWVIASTDGGRTWQYKSEVTRPPYLSYKASEGANEPALQQLANGDILCVMRTGGRFMFQSRSTDMGRTWQKPTPMPVPVNNFPGGVDPSLLLLDNGVLVCSFGRPRLCLLFSPSGDATDWTRPTAFYADTGDHYTWLWATGKDSFLMMWCQSGFINRNIKGANEVKSTEFTVERIACKKQ